MELTLVLVGRYEAPQQTNLPPPDVPGIEAHLAEQNKIINLQRTQSEVVRYFDYS